MLKTNTLKRILLPLFCCVSILAGAQDILNVSGRVFDSKTREPLISAMVIERGTSNGTVTDMDGNFSIKVKQNNSLTVKYVGYETKEVQVQSATPLIIYLSEESEELSELVVIGYGVQRKSDITGSISSVTGKDIAMVPVSSALQALQGKATGVQVIQNTGAPGSTTTIKVRGTGTVNDEQPLYVVDGFIVDNIEHINPNDIANIEILKDAASSAIYGSRSANGVVLVTTKKGETGKMKINFDAYTGFSTPWRKINVMNAENYALMRDYVNGTTNYSVDGIMYNSKDPITSEYYFDERKYQRIDTIRNNSPSSWWDAITQVGIKQQYNLSLSGGTNQHKYMISTNYYNERGIIKTSDYDRFSARINSSNKIAKWLDVQTNMLYTYTGRNKVPEGESGVLKRTLYQQPLIYMYNSAGYYYESHPVAMIERYHNTTKGHRVDLNLSLTAKISKLFTYQFKVADYINVQTTNRFSEVNKLEEAFVLPTDLTTIIRSQNLINKLEINNLLTFAWNNKVHDINAIVGHTVENYKNDYHNAQSRGSDGNTNTYWYLSSGYTGEYAVGYVNDWSAVGFVSRFNYNLLDRYLLQLNFRADGSSKFSKKQRWGFFPSVSLGWKFSSESFLENADWLSLGKIRFGWGKLGNNRINETAGYTIITNDYNYAFGTGMHILYPGATATTLGNPDITWEKTESYNLGLDFGLFRNKMSGSLEVFDKFTTDMLLRVPVAVSAGLEDAPMTNAGSVRNKGIEFLVNYKGGRAFTYNIGFNISYIKNEVVSLGTDNEPVWGAFLSESSILDYVTKTEVGRPIGSFFGYVTDGIFNDMDEVMNSAQYQVGKNELDQPTRPGDFRFIDINGDGVIDASDRTYLGSPHPYFIFGIPMSFGYKNFDLSIFFQGQTGNKVFNVMDYYLTSAHGTGNVYADLRSRHWSGSYRTDRKFFPENLNASIPDLDASDTPRNFRTSNYYVKDGSYMRLQNIRLTYTFPERISRYLSMSDFSVYVGAYNLLTFTNYNGLDPEVGKAIDSESNNLYMGVDHGTYPQARTFVIGLKLGF